LADLLLRAETDSAFYHTLCSQCAQRRSLFEPARERQSWQELLQEFTAENAESAEKGKNDKN